MGMHAAHAIVSGMGGMRTAGDLVARMQLNRGMRIDAAKSYVADKLGVSVPDLADSVTMAELREDLNIGVVCEAPGVALLDLDINCVNLFKDKIGIGSYDPVF